MDERDLVVVGAGGFGREVIDVAEAINAVHHTWRVVGVVDDAPSEANLERLACRGVEFLGRTHEPLGWPDRVWYVVGVGSPRVRRMIAGRYDAAGLLAATLVHPVATLGSDVTLGAGTVVCAGARITTNIRLGRHVHVNPNVTIGHDTVVDDFVSLNPASSISGDCVVGEGTLVGVGAVVLNQLRIGAGATVGGAACVVRDVPSGTTVKGVPAK